jgi:hypothetical protein
MTLFTSPPRQQGWVLAPCWRGGLLLLLAASAASADTPPVSGRPVRFSGAVGVFRIATQVERPTVRVGEPFLFTVHITAVGAASEAPARPDLRDLPSFANAFHIEPLGDAAGANPDKGVWEFQYRLRAKRTDLDGVPNLPFIYYRPASGAGSRGAYQTAYAPRIPLTVQPAEAPPPVTHREGDKPLIHPESVQRIATGPGLLRRPFNWEVSPATVLFLLAAGPVGCAVWYWAWRRANPSAVRVARRQRSAAARQALAALMGVARRPATEQPRAAAEAVGLYLRHRLDLPTALPSPGEVESHLKRLGVSDAVVKAASEFFRGADAARFAPGASSVAWTETGSEVVLLVEAETCSPS